MNRKPLGVGVALIASLAIAIPASATAEELSPTLGALAGVTAQDVDGSQAVLDDRAHALQPEANASVRVEENGVEVTLPEDASDGIEIASAAGTVNVGLPFAANASGAEEVAPAVFAYDNGNGTVTAPVLKDDGSVQITTIIEGPGSPSRYDYPLEVPEGAAVALEEGVVSIRSADGSLLTGIAPAWATDASGTPVPTHYELNGTKLTQVVEHSAEHAYPVVADPWAGKALISTAWVTTKSLHYVVNVQPTAWGRQYSGPATHADHVKELKTKLGTNSWRVDTNDGTIRDQFLCHVVGNAAEPGTYNMESNRAAMHWALQLNLRDRCNPIVVTTIT